MVKAPPWLGNAGRLLYGLNWCQDELFDIQWTGGLIASQGEFSKSLKANENPWEVLHNCWRQALAGIRMVWKCHWAPLLIEYRVGHGLHKRGDLLVCRVCGFCLCKYRFIPHLSSITTGLRTRSKRLIDFSFASVNAITLFSSQLNILSDCLCPWCWSRSLLSDYSHFPIQSQLTNPDTHCLFDKPN